MCRRDTQDLLVRRFLDSYSVNLLAMPGRRVGCGSVYVKAGSRISAPGHLSDIVEPPISLPQPFHEDDLADLSGVWSDSVSMNVGLGLLDNYLAALGAAGLVDSLQASFERTGARHVAFRFNRVSRDSISPTGLGRALVDRRFTTGNPWVSAGNSYYVVGAVLRSSSMSIQARDDSGASIGLGAGFATVADANVKVAVRQEGSSEVSFTGSTPLAIAVELYELRWDAEQAEFGFRTSKGPLRLQGLDEDAPPEPVFATDEALIVVEEPDPRAGTDVAAHVARS
ncbi:hypothetical protein SAMN04488107_1599 [Geodermatophilus saharensis]|uniref:Gasdermin bGSDM n=1 Tax=Geodermatophilus saharensis TaxID=1137994 RepID=A0A239C4E1_9ACTN|nr:hypothetical protein SAMN04488107_1599 [Geodermatophilus saharensis]